MSIEPQSVRLSSQGNELAGAIFLPKEGDRFPAVIVCHGAGEFKENYFEMCESLADKGVATLALDMRGHGESQGERFYVNIGQWVADIQASIDYLLTHPRIDGDRIAAFGLSSGGTAVLETGIVEPRLKVLVTLDATVRDSLPWFTGMSLRLLVLIGRIKKLFTGRDLRIPLLKLSGDFKMASDPEIQRKLFSNDRLLEAFKAFPFPGAAQAFFVNTLERASQIKIPTLVLWGEDDELDPPETGRLLYEALAGPKQMHIISGNGHVGHLDRNRNQVFALTADWVLRNLL